jgi:putative acyl-CoA dehydrogenase
MSTITHDVSNQVPPFLDVDLLAADVALAEGLEREGAGWAVDRVRDCGVVAGST